MEGNRELHFRKEGMVNRVPWLSKSLVTLRDIYSIDCVGVRA